MRIHGNVSDPFTFKHLQPTICLFYGFISGLQLIPRPRPQGPPVSPAEVIFISHQWLGFRMPDPAGLQVAVLRSALRGLMDQTLKVEAAPRFGTVQSWWDEMGWWVGGGWVNVTEN